MTTTPNLHLEPLLSAQSQKHVTVNEAFARVDAATQLAVLGRTLTDPPAAPSDGDRYLLPAAPTGAWNGRGGDVAAWEEATLGWLFLTPRPGWRLWLIDEGALIVLTATGWQAFAADLNPVSGGLLGVNTDADATNRLAVKSDAVLLSYDDVTPGTGSMQVKFNKATAADTASLLYQTGFSGRAEFGLAGSDDFSIKVSPDGSAFTTALAIDAVTAAVSLPATSLASILRAEEGPDIVARRHVTASAWLSSTSAADNNWRAMCWAPEPGLFCAVASTGTGDRVMTSPDGIAWTARISAADNEWYGICWSPELGLFCAVAGSGSGDRVMTSPDGIVWTVRNNVDNNSWRAVCWSRELGLFCAVAITGTGNRVMTSPDGITWTTRTSAADNSWLSVCWSCELGLFCAVAGTGISDLVMTSPDGIAWTVRASAADNSWRGVCWSCELGLFCAVAGTGSGDRVMTSPDGITWTTRTSAADNSWRGICWSSGLGLFCAVAGTGNGDRVMTSISGYSFPYRS